jgi:hypothetical protein
MNLTRDQRRAMKSENARWPAELKEIPKEDWPVAMLLAKRPPIRVLRSREFPCQCFPEPNNIVRLSICRTTVDLATGRWVDGISWDELQRLKREAGFGDLDAVEVFPADKDIVNVSNMRHLFVFPEPLEFAWRHR